MDEDVGNRNSGSDLRRRRDTPRPDDNHVAPVDARAYLGLRPGDDVANYVEPTDDDDTGSDAPLAQHVRGRPRGSRLKRYLGTLGQFLALAYGGLCAMGINARVLAAFGSLPLAYTIGAVTFLVNAVIFWTIVPSMLIKLFADQDLLDESFPTKNKAGQKAYVKLKFNDRIESLKFWPWQPGFSIRAWIVLSFAMFFGVCGGLVYTGLLMTTLPGTLNVMGLAGFLPMTATLGFFFGVSAICNWFFNSYDAAQQFAKNDFFAEFIHGVRQLIGLEPLYFPGEQPGSVSDLEMGLRHVARFVIFSGIAFLGFYAMYAIAHVGTLGLFGYLIPGQITGASGAVSIAKYGSSLVQAIKWTTIIGGLVGGGFLYGVQTSRFSIVATKFLTQAANHYVSFASDIENDAAKAAFLVFASPFILTTMIFQGLYAAAVAEKGYITKAYRQTSTYYNTPQGNIFGCVPRFIFYFITNNMNAFALVNSAAQGFLAMKPGESITMATEEFVGAANGSAMCYINSLEQQREIDEGRASNVQETLDVDNALLFSYKAGPAAERSFWTHNGRMQANGGDDDLEDHERFVDDLNGEIRARFAAS